VGDYLVFPGRPVRVSVCPWDGEVWIIAFILDHGVVDAILEHLAKAKARSPVVKVSGL